MMKIEKIEIDETTRSDSASGLGPKQKPNLSVVAASKSPFWMETILCRIKNAFVRNALHSEDLETWRRLEFRNEFRHEQDHRRHDWRL